MIDPTDDSFDLDRFVTAQADSYEDAMVELKSGTKKSHWMWFVFPQMRGLGQSSTSIHYGIVSIQEARAYLAHPVLGSRLIASCEAVLSVSDRTATEIFGKPDDMKLRSCATLFSQVREPGSVFHQVLDKYFAGQKDEATLRMLTLRSYPA